MFEYPKCCDWLVFHMVRDTDVIVEDYINETKIILTRSEADFLHKLDGHTNPYAIVSDMAHGSVDQLMELFEEHELIRKSRFVSKSLLSVIYTICFIHPDRRKRMIAYFLNLLLLFSFLPVLIIGASIYAKYGDIDWDYVSAGLYAGLALGMMIHESGHAIAGLAFGARVFEAGVQMTFFLPGAYVMLDDRPVKKKMRKVQIYAAGVEMNVLLAGITLSLAGITSDFGGFFFGIALQNLILAGLNIIFIRGLDGEKIISELIGKKDFVGFSAKILFHSRERKRLWSRGPQGRAATIAAFCIALVQSALPIVLVSNLIGVVTWIADLF